MNLGVTVHTAFSQHESRSPAGIAEIKIVQAAHVPAPLRANILVALLTQQRGTFRQQRRVIGAVHTMAQAAILADRVMFLQEGTA